MGCQKVFDMTINKSTMILKNSKFAKISEIQTNADLTWQKSVFLTFDIDWAHDDVFNDTIDVVEHFDSPATWFITHETPCLKRLRANRKFELGIHPNFNFLLEGDDRNGKSAAEVIENLIAIVPEAKSVRSHSLTQSSGLFNLFKKNGLTHEVNHLVPNYAGIELKPWRLWNGLSRIPYGWEDDVYIISVGKGLSEKNPNEIVSEGGIGLKVFDFHPIHIYLNTESLDRYERTRPLHNNPQELIKHRYQGYGTRNRLLELLEMVKP